MDMDKHHVVDFRWLRPRLASAGQAEAYMPLRLCAQWFPQVSALVDCCHCDAMLLDVQAPLLSMADLVYGRCPESIPPLQQEAAARIFAENLQAELQSESLVCIIPDSSDDFELSAVRNQLAAHFSDVDFLPVSIACVYDWMNCPTSYLPSQMYFLVLDIHPAGLQLTPVQAKFDEKIKRHVLERHPGMVLRDDALAEQMLSLVKEFGFPETFAQFPGWNGMDSECGRLSLLHQKNWYDLTAGLAKYYSHIRMELPAEFDDSVRELALSMGCKGRPIRLHSLANIFVKKSLACTPCAGGGIWASLQEQMPDTPLWYDYLPELSMEVMKDGLFERFPLVDSGNCRIEPLRGKTCELTINKNFTLPAGVSSISFPLMRGRTGVASRFRAVVHSPSFPLEEPAVCKLKLTYTYGAEKPFNLMFEGNFGVAHTTWQSVPYPSSDNPGPVPEIDRRPLSLGQLMPLMKEVRECFTPPSHEAEFMRASMNQNCQFYIQVSIKSPETGENIAVRCYAKDFCERYPDEIRKGDPVYIADLRRPTNKKFYVAGGVTFSGPLELSREMPRECDVLPLQEEASFIEWRYSRNFDENGNRRVSGAIVELEGEELFAPRSFFLQPDFAEKNLKKGDTIYCTKGEGNNQQDIAINVSDSQAEVPCLTGGVLRKLAGYTRKIWQYRVASQGIPPSFKNDFIAFIRGIMDACERRNCSYPCAFEAAACAMGAETPPEIRTSVVEKVRNAIPNDAGKKVPSYAYMLVGDMKQVWQRDLFKLLLEKAQKRIWSAYNSCIRALRGFNLAQETLEVSDIEELLKIAIKKLEWSRISASSGIGDTSFLLPTIRNTVRLVTLLLSSRKSNNADVRRLLCLHSYYCNRLLEILKELCNNLKKNQVDMEKEGQELLGSVFSLIGLLRGDAGRVDITMSDIDEDDEDDFSDID